MADLCVDTWPGLCVQAVEVDSIGSTCPSSSLSSEEKEETMRLVVTFGYANSGEDEDFVDDNVIISGVSDNNVRSILEMPHYYFRRRRRRRRRSRCVSLLFLDMPIVMKMISSPM